MGSKKIRIAKLGVPHDYQTSLVPIIINSLGFKIKWVNPAKADLVIYGSFYDVNTPKLRWLPRAWRERAGAYLDSAQKELAKRSNPPLTLFHTGENLRHDCIKTDFAISHDLHVSSERHFRLPYWMEVIDWSHEGIVGNSNPRYGELLKLDRLMEPLGNQFLKRAQRAILITSHLREPRASCYELLKKIVPVDGMGKYFDPNIKDHHHSFFFKKDILKKYAFNFCPENSIYPGYITEKVPEAFVSGCLPIAFSDESICFDFNPKAFINMAKTYTKNIQEKKIDLSINSISSYAHEPLLLKNLNMQSFKLFLNELVNYSL